MYEILISIIIVILVIIIGICIWKFVINKRKTPNDVKQRKENDIDEELINNSLSDKSLSLNINEFDKNKLYGGEGEEEANVVCAYLLLELLDAKNILSNEGINQFIHNTYHYIISNDEELMKNYIVQDELTGTIGVPEFITNPSDETINTIIHQCESNLFYDANYVGKYRKFVEYISTLDINGIKSIFFPDNVYNIYGILEIKKIIICKNCISENSEDYAIELLNKEDMKACFMEYYRMLTPNDFQIQIIILNSAYLCNYNEIVIDILTNMINSINYENINAVSASLNIIYDYLDIIETSIDLNMYLENILKGPILSLNITHFKIFERLINKVLLDDSLLGDFNKKIYELLNTGINNNVKIIQETRDEGVIEGALNQICNQLYALTYLIYYYNDIEKINEIESSYNELIENIDNEDYKINLITTYLYYVSKIDFNNDETFCEAIHIISLFTNEELANYANDIISCFQQLTDKHLLTNNIFIYIRDDIANDDNTSIILSLLLSFRNLNELINNEGNIDLYNYINTIIKNICTDDDYDTIILCYIILMSFDLCNYNYINNIYINQYIINVFYNILDFFINICIDIGIEHLMQYIEYNYSSEEVNILSKYITTESTAEYIKDIIFNEDTINEINESLNNDPTIFGYYDPNILKNSIFELCISYIEKIITNENKDKEEDIVSAIYGWVETILIIKDIELKQEDQAIEQEIEKINNELEQQEQEEQDIQKQINEQRIDQLLEYEESGDKSFAYIVDMLMFDEKNKLINNGTNNLTEQIFLLYIVTYYRLYIILDKPVTDGNDISDDKERLIKFTIKIFKFIKHLYN